MMDELIPTLEYSEEDWETLARNWGAWWAGEHDRPLVMIASPLQKRVREELTIEFLLHKPVDQVLDFYQSRFANTRLSGDAGPKWFPFFGAGVAAAFLGAELLCAPDEGTIWFEPARPLESFDLAGLFDGDNLWWQRVQQLTQAAIERWGDRVCVGITDLGGNLDILASLRGSQQLLMDLLDCPDEIEAATRQITRLWLRYYRELHAITQQNGRGTTPWAPIWAPGRCYMLQSDFSAMVSPKMFERFVLPDLIACCNALDYAFYHMDGKGQIPHLDLILSIDGLHGIQWIPGDGQPPPEAWLPLLERIRRAGKLCQLFVSAAGALEIVRELGGKGFAFGIIESLGEDEAKTFLKEIKMASLLRG
jgi:5-methyltetrahydrofolate--homocysteine methyltransferase